jgi:hypothetical protein
MIAHYAETCPKCKVSISIVINCINWIDDAVSSEETINEIYGQNIAKVLVTSCIFYDCFSTTEEEYAIYLKCLNLLKVVQNAPLNGQIWEQLVPIINSGDMLLRFNIPERLVEKLKKVGVTFDHKCTFVEPYSRK